jgi:hypothetical protein
LASEPDLWSEPLLDRLMPEKIRFFRLIDLACRAGTDRFDAKLAHNLMKGQDRKVIAAYRILWRKAMVRIATRHKGLHPIRLAAALGAFLSDPMIS